MPMDNVTSQPNGAITARMALRNQFWSQKSAPEPNAQPASTKDSSRGEPNEDIKRPESVASRQFRPKKQQTVSDAWIREQQNEAESRDDMPFCYTPFKSTGMGRESAQQMMMPTAMARPPVTPTPPQYPIVAASPQVHAQTYQSLQKQPSLSSINDLHIQSQSTPKPTSRMATNNFKQGKLPDRRVYPNEGYGNRNAQTNPAWTRNAYGVHSGGVTGGGYRPASAMAHPTMTVAGQAATMQRPNSRATSEAAFGAAMAPASRYQSYCTLPRPEHYEDAHYATEINTVAQQVQMQYGNGAAGTVNFAMNAQTPYAMPHPKTGQMLAPGMASDFIQPGFFGTLEQQRALSDDMRPPRDLVNWNSLSLCCSMQVLCSLGIFGIGVSRTMMGAKWAIGIEIVFACLVLLSGLLGIYSVRQRHHCTAVASLALTALNGVLAVIPLLIGLFPAIPLAFNVDKLLFINEREPIEIDLALTLVCATQMILAMLTCAFACMTAGNALTHIEQLRLQADMRAAFDCENPSMEKPMVKLLS